MGQLIGLIMMVIIIGLPIASIVISIRNYSGKALKYEKCNDIVGTFGGFVLCYMLVTALGYVKGMERDYNQSVREGHLHRLLNSQSEWAVWLVIFLGFLGLFLLILRKPEDMPPLVSAFAIASLIPADIVGIFLIIQTTENLSGAGVILLFYYFGVLTVEGRRIQYHIAQQTERCRENSVFLRTKLAKKLYRIMSKISGFSMVTVLAILPIAAILEVLFVLFGQGPDELIHAFTQTADWTFSQQIPPPCTEAGVSGHYLCTVAAGGHEKLVKPLRYGKRQGGRIIVNRQLLAANAFEDLIAERTPRFHKAIRTFYDKHGYPLSKHITTKLRADIVYILMKPLELIFIVTLYLFDTAPENRIAMQYTGKTSSELRVRS